MDFIPDFSYGITLFARVRHYETRRQFYYSNNFCYCQVKRNKNSYNFIDESNLKT